MYGGEKYNELTFQAMVDAVPSALIMVNKESKIAYLNLHAEKLFKYSRNQIIGQGVEILIPERLRVKHPGLVTSFFSTPQARSMGAGRELYALKKDGTEFPVEIGLNPLVTVDGIMVLAAIIDITERKKAEYQFRLVVESAPNAMVLVNQDGKITMVNRQTDSLFGYVREELIGQNVEILIPERFIGRHPSFRNNFFSELKARPMGAGRDLFATRKDGSEFPVEIGLNPIETPDGKAVLASIIDISERKIRDEAIQKQKELEGKNKELEQFAYITSHDLSEPLRTLNNYTDLFREEYELKLDSNAAGYLKAMSNAINRMSVLIGALLNYSRLGRNMVLSRVNFNKIAEEVISDLQSAIVSNHVKISVSDLPTMNANEIEMRQLFQNLISNAIKFRKADCNPEVSIDAKRLNNNWKFAISDNGIGIDPKYRHRIFQIFQRLNSTGKYEGYGIGLANCKKIVELHGGDIWVESVLEEGSTFYFTMPDEKIR